MKIIKRKDTIIEKDIDISSYSLIKEQEEDPVLCNHCLRTASNGIRCMGICVADNEY
tara:strand:- start:241 stop:411 length:171 start_codon:yes stop_codon:yes gene_type:complete